MDTSRLSSKGQIIIPKAVREAHHWRAGMEFVMESVGDGILLRPIKPFPPTRLEDGVGCAGYSGPARTLAEMEQGVLEDVRRKWREGGRAVIAVDTNLGQDAELRQRAMSVAGRFSSDVKDLSEEHDAYLAEALEE